MVHVIAGGDDITVAVRVTVAVLRLLLGKGDPTYTT
jgi:hypothetical protein